MPVCVKRGSSAFVWTYSFVLSFYGGASCVMAGIILHAAVGGRRRFRLRASFSGASIIYLAGRS